MGGVKLAVTNRSSAPSDVFEPESCSLKLAHTARVVCRHGFKVVREGIRKYREGEVSRGDACIRTGWSRPS